MHCNSSVDLSKESIIPKPVSITATGEFFSIKSRLSNMQKSVINIVPEIDMPGHPNATLASYAELNCYGKENILGIKPPLHTESIKNIKEIEYMKLPRLPGYAEIGWTPPALRNWDDYKELLGKHGERFKALEINFYHSGLIQWAREKL